MPDELIEISMDAFPNIAWGKIVTDIDPNVRNGYGIHGVWINKGDAVQVKKGTVIVLKYDSDKYVLLSVVGFGEDGNEKGYENLFGAEGPRWGASIMDYMVSHGTVPAITVNRMNDDDLIKEIMGRGLDLTRFMTDLQLAAETKRRGLDITIERMSDEQLIKLMNKRGYDII